MKATALKVKDHKLFCCFDYTSVPSPGIVELGDVVFKIDDNVIGVVIQTHGDHEFRTDMFGNACTSEVRNATIADIKNYRPDLLFHLIK